MLAFATFSRPSTETGSVRTLGSLRSESPATLSLRSVSRSPAPPPSPAPPALQLHLPRIHIGLDIGAADTAEPAAEPGWGDPGDDGDGDGDEDIDSPTTVVQHPHAGAGGHHHARPDSARSHTAAAAHRPSPAGDAAPPSSAAAPPSAHQYQHPQQHQHPQQQHLHPHEPHQHVVRRPASRPVLRPSRSTLSNHFTRSEGDNASIADTASIDSHRAPASASTPALVSMPSTDSIVRTVSLAGLAPRLMLDFPTEHMAVPSTAEAELVVLREENDHLRETIRQQAVVKQQLQRELNAALREITTLARSSTLAQSFVELKARFVELQAQCAALEEALGRLPPVGPAAAPTAPPPTLVWPQQQPPPQHLLPAAAQSKPLGHSSSRGSRSSSNSPMPLSPVHTPSVGAASLADWRAGSNRLSIPPRPPSSGPQPAAAAAAAAASGAAASSSLSPFGFGRPRSRSVRSSATLESEPLARVHTSSSAATSHEVLDSETPKLERLTLSTSIGTSGDGADGDDGKVLSPSSLAADAMAILAAGTAAAQSAAHFEGNVLRVAPSRTSSLAARQQSTSSSSAGTRPDAPHPGPTSGSKSFALKHGQSGGNALAINTSFVPPPPGPPSSTPLPRTPTTVISASASAKRASWHPYTALSRSATSIMTAASASNSSLSSTSSSSPQPGAGLQLIDETVDERTENMVFTRGKHTSVNLPLSQGSQPHSDPDQISASLGSGSDARHGMLDFFRISRRKTVSRPALSTSTSTPSLQARMRPMSPTMTSPWGKH
ncbi:hypothetical protein HK105_202756 [Polyrhizophydium stewartii]|uniref:Uncharacterized protein n=1 Tax=Polyrhizophydium stewartii TaxID=2732419 RepID=A0ABR4NED9_9FUNG